MNITAKAALVLTLAFLFSLIPSTAYAEEGLPVGRLVLPEGFKVSLFAANVKGARCMTLSPSGTLFVGTRLPEGLVYAIPDANHDYKGDRIITICKGLNNPNGVEYRDGSLYVGEIDRILRYDNVDKHLDKLPEPVIVNDSLPKEKHHGQKYIRFGPDGWLYVPIGAPCNCCESKDPRFATLMRMKADGSDFQIFARGIRNTVGFDWHPQTQALWFTDNGRDWLGDDRPPEELNCADKANMHFGFPYCHGGFIADPVFGKGHTCDEFTPPALKLPAHVAALGIKFYTGKMFGPQYEGGAFICEHGSWNRTVPDGYRVVFVSFKNNQPDKSETFASGWLQPFGVWGRPVDLLVLPDGSLLISDDHAGAIYRVYK